MGRSRVIARSRGLTVAEVVVAIGVLAIMLVTTLLLFTQLMASTTKNNLVNLGSLYADRILEQMVASPNPAPPAFSALTTGEESVVSHGDGRSTTFAYRVEATSLTPVQEPGEQWLLEVEVHWWHADPNTPNQDRRGYGRLSTKQRRMVYIKRGD